MRTETNLRDRAVPWPNNVVTLREALGAAQQGGYAVGAFAARYTPLVQPIVHAAQELQSPAIVQISQKELDRYGITPAEVAAELGRVLAEGDISVPLVLHLDHTRDLDVIAGAIAAGFTSVMIDASEKPLEENIAISQAVAEYAHARGVSVEAELGRIGTTDFVETEHDEEMYTDPAEAERFVAETGVDALAVSVGTAHGVYQVRQPRIDYDRLRAIGARTGVPLVLHGGSGVPADMMGRAIRLPEGGVRKVNIATDLELALLAAVGREERMTNAECLALPPEVLAAGRDAVARTVRDKIEHYVLSGGKATGIVGGRESGA